ncbi:MAG TPA: hypothetical protein VH684_01675 [Xanthobacteraceae bacterium]|jgi:hypothetical protein
MGKRSVPRQRPVIRWRISVMRHRLEPLGDVEAPDEVGAIAKAIKEYRICEPWRQRWLMAKRYA